MSRRPLDAGSTPDLTAVDGAVGTNHRARPHRGPATQRHASEQLDIRVEEHVDVDVGRGRIAHGHTRGHPALIDPLAHRRLGLSELNAIVHSRRLHRIRCHHSHGWVASIMEDSHRIGQVVLALSILR